MEMHRQSKFCMVVGELGISSSYCRFLLLRSLTLVQPCKVVIWRCIISLCSFTHNVPFSSCFLSIPPRLHLHLTEPTVVRAVPQQRQVKCSLSRKCTMQRDILHQQLNHFNPLLCPTLCGLHNVVLNPQLFLPFPKRTRSRSSRTTEAIYIHKESSLSRAQHGVVL